MGTEQADAPEQPPIDIKVLTGPPGCRKTTRMREDALRVPGLYLFSMPTKALIEEQAAEFRKAQPSLPVFSVHADIKPKRKINRQIEEALTAVRDGGHQHAVVMLTHVSMMAEDLTGFHGWHARITISTLFAMTACGSPTPSEPGSTTAAAATTQTTTADCRAKGETYFQGIESWPKLSDGRDARSVAAERCSRTTGAFDGLM